MFTILHVSLLKYLLKVHSPVESGSFIREGYRVTPGSKQGQVLFSRSCVIQNIVYGTCMQQNDCKAMSITVKLTLM